jgi:hypothetical protein
MSSIVEWFKVGTHGLWSLLCLVVAVDILCAHSKNPKLNHAAGILALVVQKLMDLIRVSKIPVFGAALSGLLDIVIGVPSGGLPPPASTLPPSSETPTPPERPADLALPKSDPPKAA